MQFCLLLSLLRQKLTAIIVCIKFSVFITEISAYTNYNELDVEVQSMENSITQHYFSCSPEFNYLNTAYCGSFYPNPSYSFGSRSGDKYILTYVKSGKGYYNINNNSFLVTAGSSYMIFPGYIYSHSPDPDDPWEYSWFEVHGNMLDKLLHLTEMTPDYPIHVHTDFLTINRITEDILLKYNTNSIQCELYRIGLLHSYFTEIINDVSGPIKVAPLLEHIQSNKYIRKAIEFIVENYSNDISVSNISDYVGLDRSYFSRLFKKITNSTPSTYLANYQMSQAKYLFTYTDYKIEEIANLVGYKNVNQFSRMFKFIVYMTPSEFRRQNHPK